MTARVRECACVHPCLCSVICVHMCACAFHRWSVKAIHSAFLSQPPHYSPLSPLNTCIPQPTFSSWAHTLLLFVPAWKEPAQHINLLHCLYLCTGEGLKKGPSYCGLYWLSIKRTLSGDSLVIYEQVIKAAGLSYVRTRSRMKAAHTEALISDTCFSQSWWRGTANAPELKHSRIYGRQIYALHRSNEGLFIWVSLSLSSWRCAAGSEIFIFALGI